MKYLTKVKKMFNKLDRREKNVKIFEDTTAYIKENVILKGAVKHSLESQKMYLETEKIDDCENNSGSVCNTIVSKKRSFEAASDYARQGKKVCVLNFASSTNPGGGVTSGSSAQEEALCRCSTLYPCLCADEFWYGFYLPHRDLNDSLHNDDCIYTPGVIVFKSDDDYPKRMKELDWYEVDVLTCAAPNLRYMPSNYMNPFEGEEAARIDEENLLQLHIKRIERIFGIAANNGVQVLILGAFGCGAFRNPPKIVAKAFSIVQKKYENVFETVEYAIYCRDYETDNYKAFVEAFEK